MRPIDADALIAKFESAKQGSDLRDTLYLCGVQAVIENFPTLESTRDWTPCAEGLPTPRKVCLVTYSVGDILYMTLSAYINEKYGWTGFYEGKHTVIAWQHIEPYRTDDTTGKVKED